MKTEYEVITSTREYNTTGYKEFIKKVNDRISDGWKCQGGVSISYCPSNFGGYECHYAQAMIREIEE